jgi:hypothetical protein
MYLFPLSVLVLFVPPNANSLALNDAPSLRVVPKNVNHHVHPLSPSSIEFVRNMEMHKEAIDRSENLFYGFDFDFDEDVPQPTMEWHKYSFPGPENYPGTDATPPPPMAMHDLARVSLQPFLTAEECASIIDEAETMGKYFGTWSSQARYGTPIDRVGAILPLEELSTSYTLIQFELLPKLFSNLCTTFDCLKDSQSTLRLGGARLVRYDADAGQVELGFHRDGLLLTANIALNDQEEYTGGGTIIEALSATESKSSAVRLPMGHVLVHPGDVRHCGAPITSGKRYVLVLFLMDKEIVPHDRYCAEQGERDMALVRNTSDAVEKERLLASAAKHFSDAIRCGARID